MDMPNSFIVTLPDLNYVYGNYDDVNVSQNVPQNVPQKSDIETIKDAIKNNGDITRKELARLIGKTIKTVQRLIKADGTIKYVGSSKSGHWEIIDK